MKLNLIAPILATLLLCACASHDVPTAAREAPPVASAGGTTAGPASAASVAQALATQGVQVTGSLDAPAGFAGYLGTYQGHPIPVYALPDGWHLVIGNLLDLDGHDLTASAMAKAASSGPGEAQWQQLAKANWFVEGNPLSKRIVYAFEDTRCPFCHMLWQESNPVHQAGQGAGAHHPRCRDCTREPARRREGHRGQRSGRRVEPE